MGGVIVRHQRTIMEEIAMIQILRVKLEYLMILNTSEVSKNILIVS